jgi:hypothetical protein
MMIDKGELSVMAMAQRAADRGDLLAEKNAEIARLRANHKDIVETKRGIEARLKTALAALQQIYTVACDGFERATAHKTGD